MALALQNARSSLQSMLDAFPLQATTTTPFALRHWHDASSRWQALKRASQLLCGASNSTTDRLERLRAIFGFVEFPTMDASATAELHEAVVKDDRFQFALRSIQALEDDAIRPTLTALYATFIIDDNMDDDAMFDVASELASQDVLDLFSATEDAELSPEERALPVCARYLKGFLLDMLTVGVCSVEEATPMGRDRRAHQQQQQLRSLFSRRVDAAVRTLLALAYMWQRAASFIRQRLIVEGASQIAGYDVSKGPRAPPTIEQRLKRRVVLRGPYAVTGERRVYIPDMLPPHIQKTGIHLCRKTDSNIHEHKRVAAKVLSSADKLQQALATRHNLRLTFEAMRRTGEPTRGLLVPVSEPTEDVANRRRSPPRAKSTTPATRPRSPLMLGYNADAHLSASMIEDDGEGVEHIIQQRERLASPPPPPAATEEGPATSSIRPAPIFASQQRRRRQDEREVFTIHHCTAFASKEPEALFNNSLSPTMAQFNRFQFKTEKIRHQLEPEQARQQQVEARRAKMLAARTRALREHCLQL